jgi:hypothetical protein
VFPNEERLEIRRRVEDAVVDALRQLGGSGRRRVVLARAEELAAFGPQDRAVPPSPGGREHHASCVDECLHWALTNLKRQGSVDNPARGMWALAKVVAGPERLAPPVSAQRLGRLRAMPYTAYLHSAEWRRTREAALVLAGHRCQLDAAHGGPLDVHHSDYARLGEETTADVTVLCVACHRRYHHMHGRPSRPKVAQPLRAVDPPRRSIRRRVRSLLSGS